MSNLYFVSGQISALESQLLTRGQLDRMIGAPSPDEAFSVMSELSYAQYFDESLKAKDFAKVIETGLGETKKLLVDGTDNHSVLGFVWWRFDLNNIKRALKEKFLEGATSIGDFNEDNGYARLGTLDADEIQAAVFEGAEVSDLRPEFAAVLTKYLNKDSLESIQDLEIELDTAYFTILKKVGKGPVKSYVKYLIDDYNLRVVARNTLIFEREMQEEQWMSGGTLSFHVFKGVDTQSFRSTLKQTPFAAEFTHVKESISSEELLFLVEQGVDRYVYSWLGNESLGSDSILRVLYYFEQRLQNARVLKTIMLSKFYGLTHEAIEEKLKHIGH